MVPFDRAVPTTSTRRSFFSSSPHDIPENVVLPLVSTRRPETVNDKFGHLPFTSCVLPSICTVPWVGGDGGGGGGGTVGEGGVGVEPAPPAALCLTVNTTPAIRTVPVRAAPLFAATCSPTAPLALPDWPDEIPTQGTSLVADQLQPDSVSS